MADNWTWERYIFYEANINISIMQSRKFTGPVKYFTAGWYFDVQPCYGTRVKTGNPLLQLLAHCCGSQPAFIVSHFTFISSHKVSQCWHKLTEYQLTGKSMGFLHGVGRSPQLAKCLQIQYSASSCRHKYLYRCAGLPGSGGDTDHPILGQFGAHN